VLDRFANGYLPQLPVSGEHLPRIEARALRHSNAPPAGQRPLSRGMQASASEGGSSAPSRRSAGATASVRPFRQAVSVRWSASPGLMLGAARHRAGIEDLASTTGNGPGAAGQVEGRGTSPPASRRRERAGSLIPPSPPSSDTTPHRFEIDADAPQSRFKDGRRIKCFTFVGLTSQRRGTVPGKRFI
jgi:hypothetical protein